MSNKMPVPFGAEKQLEFLQHLEQCGNKTLAAARTGVSISTITRSAKKNKKFGEWLAIAQAKALDELVSVAKDRAVRGVEEPVFYRDEQIGTKTVYDNNLLKFLIESNERGSYNKKEGGNTSVTVNQQYNVSDDTTLSKLSTFLKIDLNGAAERQESLEHSDDLDMDGEDSPESQQEAPDDDIINAEYDDTTKE